jgi:hypothetical protein
MRTPVREKGLLFTEAGLYCHPLTALGAPARDYSTAALGFHPSAKSVGLRPVAPVGLESALGHELWVLLIPSNVWNAKEKYK